MAPHKKKSGGVRSGDLAGQGMGPPLPIQFLYFVSRKEDTNDLKI
jgi:hypothetical protein